jgi:hypothetical protein
MQGIGTRLKERCQEKKERWTADSHHGDPRPKDPPAGGDARWQRILRTSEGGLRRGPARWMTERSVRK